MDFGATKEGWLGVADSGITRYVLKNEGKNKKKEVRTKEKHSLESCQRHKEKQYCY